MIYITMAKRFCHSTIEHRNPVTAPPEKKAATDICAQFKTLNSRQPVYSSDRRKEAGDELDEPLPAEACRLAAPLERCEPEPLHLVEEPPQARVVSHLTIGRRARG